ncbi:hypothetical protein CDV36_014246 [Fusarium kuroshium]|uniref:Uncharacterized protein n=1 Tax=Fusarium kuroshium TaxID=2010991 RepID=A0A3M2RIC5_9HYPO|nr:hypothetical protein CDV36_014246 [Fusarium kuroshium]
MDLDPWYSAYVYDQYTACLKVEAIAEIMTMTPYQKQALLGTYGLTSPCRAIVHAVMRGMYNTLGFWAFKRGVDVMDLEQPFLRPEAFRLETGCIIWPTPDYVSLMVPLGDHTARIELLPRGTDYVIPALWEPTHVLFLNEMGMRFTGGGSLRFIYIMLRKEPALRVVQYGMGNWTL